MENKNNITDKVTLQGVVKLVEQNYLQADALLQKIREIKHSLGLFEDDEDYSVCEIADYNNGLVHIINDKSIDVRKALFLAENDLLLIESLIK